MKETFFYRPAVHKWRHVGQTYDENIESMPTEYFEAFQMLRAALTTESSIAHIPGLGNIRRVGVFDGSDDPSYSIVLEGEP